MRILFIGDIFGSPGRETVKKVLPEILEEHKPDLVIANVENLTHGNGFSPEHIEEMRKVGVQYFTSGNHFTGVKEGIMKMDDPKFPVLRPANYPPENVPGRGYMIVEDGMMNKVLIVNLIGRVFMNKNYDCPFRKMDEILRENAHERFAAIFVDFHAEVTSEKYALGLYLDGRVSAFIGTHTHVPTCDLRVMPEGTAYMSDVGFCGAVNSVIGVSKDLIINSFLTQLPMKLEPEKSGEMVFSAILVEVDEKSQKALKCEHLYKFL